MRLFFTSLFISQGFENVSVLNGAFIQEFSHYNYENNMAEY